MEICIQDGKKNCNGDLLLFQTSYSRKYDTNSNLAGFI